ncbi:S-layer homology domain-containing protein [Desulfonispora thiosulfatigenes DSM 11270]|uniref:S-layer homology domain-containing protein n=1 Tax=Desulfonispora thiosulfatigenes DSM 11270 TaxID=656914 RepID=A0A1W1V6C0_DESTI|nr:S-layer homology domain-containing protein [Desulfonispora thiosulfatigenes]SMB88957.1 S-layer homology domain-containing protein [Desulfonispora thiosulfatigenes DSM 11270]
MVKKILTLAVLGIFLCGTMVSYAADVSEGVLVDVLDKASDHPRKDEILGVIGESLKTDGGIDFAKAMIDSTLSKEEKQKLNDKGISEQDIKNSLDDLKSWAPSERADLVNYVKNNQMDKAKDLIKSKGLVESNTPSKPGGGGAAANTDNKTEDKPADKPDATKPDTTKPEANKPGTVTPNVPQATNFKDIKGHWAQKNIEKMAALKLVGGMTNDTFAPESSVTRSQMIALIARIFDVKETTGQGELPFTDLKKGDWDYNVVQAAYAAKLASGTSATTFEPNKPVTREQMMAMVMNGLKYKNINLDVTNSKDLKAYKDYNKISNWALDSMQQGVDLGLIAGKTKETLEAKGTATRAEAVTILERVYNLVK